MGEAIHSSSPAIKSLSPSSSPLKSNYYTIGHGGVCVCAQVRPATSFKVLAGAVTPGRDPEEDVLRAQRDARIKRKMGFY